MKSEKRAFFAILWTPSGWWVQRDNAIPDEHRQAAVIASEEAKSKTTVTAKPVKRRSVGIVQGRVRQDRILTSDGAGVHRERCMI